MSDICSIPDCGKPHDAKGYCSSHYTRMRRHGDPLGGGTSIGDPLRFIHEVALVHTSEDCLLWPYGKNRDGYGKIRIDGKKFVVSRYVCQLVRGEPPTPDHEASHSCGRGHLGCISPEHLGWKTPAENQADRLVHGTHSRGERCGRAKLTEAAVREILALKGKETQLNLAEMFGVSKTAVGSIHTGRNWAWLSSEGAQ
jgi:hypothetical protein